MGEIPSIFAIKVSPFLSPYRGILHASDLPQRHGRRPTIGGTAPQRQKDQKTTLNQFEVVQNRLHNKAVDYPRDLLFEQSFLERLGGSWALKVRKQTHPATSTSAAWSTTTAYTSRPERAWIKRFGYEIAHAHHADGSMHVILHPEDVRTVIEQGWGERHPLASTSWHWMFYWDSVKSLWNPASRPPVPETLVFLYAPRNKKEVDCIVRIIDAAIWYFTGEEVDSNAGKGTHRKDRYLDEFNVDGTIKVRGELDAGWPSTQLLPSTGAQARADEKAAFKEAEKDAAKPTPRQSSFISPVPTGLDADEGSIYHTLAEVHKHRKHSRESPPNIVIITDIAKDYDDLVAMVLLKELHRLGLVKLLGFVANLKPARKRAIYGRGALDALGLQDLPISIGTDGIGPILVGGEEVHVEHPYEFTGSFYTELENHPPALNKGSELLEDICTGAKNTGEKITFLLLSSLQDISEFSSANPALFKAVTKNVVLQGAYNVDPLEPDFASANNKFHQPAAKSFHDLMASMPIQSAVYTKWAAYGTPLTAQLFTDLAATGHVLGQHLRTVQIAQDKEYYSGACTHGRFMSPERFLEKKTSWYDTHTEADVKPNHETDEIVPYLTKVVVYDALAALGAAGQDLLTTLDIKTASTELHEVVGVLGPDNVPVPGIKGVNMAKALTTLLKGSLLASMQGLTASF
jgi:hypothetical protein